MCSYFRWEKPDIPIGVCLNENNKFLSRQETEEST